MGNFFFNCLVGCFSMTVWTPAGLGVLYACVLYFCICTGSPQLSMFHMERSSRNTLIIILIIINAKMTTNCFFVNYIEGFWPEWCILLYIMCKIHHSGWEPSISKSQKKTLNEEWLTAKNDDKLASLRLPLAHTPGRVNTKEQEKTCPPIFHSYGGYRQRKLGPVTNICAHTAQNLWQ